MNGEYFDVIYSLFIEEFMMNEFLSFGE